MCYSIFLWYQIYTSLALPTLSSSVPPISVIAWPAVEGLGRQLRMFVNYVLFLSIGSTCAIQRCQYITHTILKWQAHYIYNRLQMLEICF